MKERLTEEQKQIVEDNHNLIYWYAKLKGLDLEDWYDNLAIELCYTVMNHNPKRGSLSNYYKVRCDGLVVKEIRMSMALKRRHFAVPLDEETLDTIGDGIGKDFEDIYIDSILAKNEYGNIIKMRYLGMTQTQIAEAVGMSQPEISVILKKVREEFDYDGQVHGGCIK